ncbi:MAG: hypothetical protein ACE5KH_00340 [Candidatus Geothermarchaeales archaeon]
MFEMMGNIDKNGLRALFLLTLIVGALPVVYAHIFMEDEETRQGSITETWAYVSGFNWYDGDDCVVRDHTHDSYGKLLPNEVGSTRHDRFTEGADPNWKAWTAGNTHYWDEDWVLDSAAYAEVVGHPICPS